LVPAMVLCGIVPCVAFRSSIDYMATLGLSAILFCNHLSFLSTSSNIFSVYH